MSSPKVLIVLMLALALVAPAGSAMGGPFDRIKKKVQKAVEDKVVDATTDAVQCAMDDKECIDKAKKDGKDVVLVDADGNVVDDPPADAAGDPAAASGAGAGAGSGSGEQPGQGVWRNYDYTPARDVWRHVEFDDERVGRFPAGQLEFVKGNMQIVEKDGKRVLEVSSASVFRVMLDDVLQEDFTLEFDLQIGAPNILTYVYFSELDTSHSRYESYYLRLYHSPGVAHKGKVISNIGNQHQLSQKMMPIRLQVDGEYTILYVDTERAANIPNAKFFRTKVIEFHVGGNPNHRSYIDNITVAVGLDRLYESLMETGSFTTRGIYFDVDSARLRPESTPTLIEIEDTLKRHEDLSIAIEGHTDSTGSDEHNLTLSENRAKAVVDYLVGRGIGADRLSHAGLGETKPVGDNATPAGRQQNRRVVIVRK